MKYSNQKEGLRAPVTGMFLPMSTPLCVDPEAMRCALVDIASKGFEVVYLQFRDSLWEATDPEAISAVQHAVAVAKSLRLQIWLSLIPDNVNGPKTFYSKQWPEAVQTVMRSDSAQVTNGNAEFKWWSGRMGRRYLDVAGAWLVVKGADPLDVTSVIKTDFQAENVYRNTHDRGYRMEGYGKLAVSNLPSEGELWLYTKWTMPISGYPRYIDYAREEWAEFGEHLLQCHGDLEIDGIGWDEFCVSFPIFNEQCDFGALTPSYFERFARQYGYRLEAKLYALDHGDSVETAQVRFHHWQCLANLHHEVLKRWKERVARNWPKKDFTMGIHMTLVEWSCDDIATGTLDVFGAVTGQSAGFTDSMFYREDGMLFSILLARGLGDRSESGRAWNNSWDHKPNLSDLNYFTRVMGMHRTSWLAHMYGPTYDAGPGYPEHQTWVGMEKHVLRLQELDELLEGYEPESEIALVYTWAGCARFTHPREMHLLREGQIQAVKAATGAGYGVGIIPPEEVADGAVEGEFLVAKNGQRFHTLLVPWSEFLPLTFWESLERFISAGGVVIFWGPTPRRTAEGHACLEQFEELVGAGIGQDASSALEFSLGDVAVGANCSHAYIVDPEIEFLQQQGQPDHWRTVKVPKLSVREGAVALSFQGSPVAVRHGKVYYTPLELPLLRGLLEAVLSDLSMAAPVSVPAGVWARVLRHRISLETRLAVVGRRDSAIDGVVEWEGRTCDPQGSRFAIFNSEQIIYDE
jgi:hypothetical protein